MIKKISCILNILVLCSCMKLGQQNSQYEARLNQWVGKSSSQLYETWGMPIETQQFNSDTLFAIYYQSESQPIDDNFQPYDSELSYSAMSVPNYGLPEPPPLFYCKTTFIIKNGIITDFNFNGDDCY